MEAFWMRNVEEMPLTLSRRTGPWSGTNNEGRLFWAGSRAALRDYWIGALCDNGIEAGIY